MGLLDLTALENLREEIGDALFEIVPLFIRDSGAILEQMAAEYHAGQFDLVLRHAHTLKANAANFGASALAKLARRVERLLLNNELSEARHCIEEMGRLYPKVVVALERELARLRG
jgi:HPt (histidine-containing phosphotransfer) domain-containing protein